MNGLVEHKCVTCGAQFYFMPGPIQCNHCGGVYLLPPDSEHFDLVRPAAEAVREQLTGR